MASGIPNLQPGLPAIKEPSGCWHEELFSSRLLFVMGKGGVGKTTISIILALAAARGGQKTLLAEVGDSDAVGRLFQEAALTEHPRELSPNLWGARINPRTELESYVRTHVSPGFIAGKIIRSRLFDYLFEAAPGLKEVMSLGRLWRWATQDQQALGDIDFDLIIVDAPATGHALSLLRLPDTLIKMIRIGPVANQIRSLQELLKDRRKTRLVLVSLPEELPINETVELYAAAKDSLEMPVAATFINGVYPSIFSPEEAEQITSLENKYRASGDSMENRLLSSASDLIRRSRDQRKYVESIRSAAPSHVQEVPFCFTGDLSLTDIRELSVFQAPKSPPKSPPKGPLEGPLEGLPADPGSSPI